jgi:hypothetical protein
MLWIGKTGIDTPTDFAAFAVKAGCAAVRWCKDINAVKSDGNTAAENAAVNEPLFKTNVKKKCVNTDGVDFCYADEQLIAQNEVRRLRKGTDELEEDKAGSIEIAKAIKAIVAGG